MSDPHGGGLDDDDFDIAAIDGATVTDAVEVDSGGCASEPEAENDQEYEYDEGDLRKGEDHSIS
jgi:hypothetical protein